MLICLDKFPFKLEDCTPQAIRAWVRDMQDEGLAGRSIELRCAMYRGIVQTVIKFGLLKGHDNPWKLVDFSSNSSKPIYTAREEDYRKVSTFIDSLPDAARLPLLIQIYTGCRISEVLDRKAEDFDLEAQTMSITEGKNKFSICTIPLPAFICDQLRSSSFKFWKTGGMNKFDPDPDPQRRDQPQLAAWDHSTGSGPAGRHHDHGSRARSQAPRYAGCLRIRLLGAGYEDRLGTRVAAAGSMGASCQLIGGLVLPPPTALISHP